MDAQRISAVVWPDLLAMSHDQLVDLERELLERLVPSPVYAAEPPRRPSQLDSWLTALKPKNAQEAAIILTAVATLLTSVHGVSKDGAPPPPPPAVTVIVEAPQPVITPPDVANDIDGDTVEP